MFYLNLQGDEGPAMGAYIAQPCSLFPVCFLFFPKRVCTARVEEESLGFEDEQGGQKRAQGWEDGCSE